MSERVHLDFSGDEALVLYELLARLDGEVPGLHAGEKAALWRLEGSLESQLTELFQPDYAALVRAARDRLAGGPGTGDVTS